MSKDILILKADGAISRLDHMPTLAEMQEILGGYVEHVNVLDRIESGEFVYTSMFVNDSGLLDGLPRNEHATEAYQRNIRAQFPDEIQPFQAADKAFDEQAAKDGFTVIRPPEVVPGYDADPFIAGDAILFQGYTCEEVDREMSRASRQRDAGGRGR